jgi:hypothetical protein
MRSIEWDRIAFIRDRDGEAEAVDFARRTYKIYRQKLLEKRHVLNRRGMHDRKVHHATLPQYRRAFIESCLIFRWYIRTYENRCLQAPGNRV